MGHHKFSSAISNSFHKADNQLKIVETERLPCSNSVTAWVMEKKIRSIELSIHLLNVFPRRLCIFHRRGANGYFEVETVPNLHLDKLVALPLVSCRNDAVNEALLIFHNQHSPELP